MSGTRNFNLASSEPFPGEPLLASGWVYRDVPRALTPEFWDLLLETIGRGNYRIIAMSEGRQGDEIVWQRGQLLISPAGMANIRAHALADHKPIDM